MCVRWLDSLDSWLAGCYGGRRERRRGVSGGYVLVVLPCGFAACFASLRLGAPVVALETIYRRRQRHRCRHSRDLRSRTMRNCATWHVGCQAGVQQCGGKAKQFAQERLESRVEAKDLAKKEFLDKQIKNRRSSCHGKQANISHTHTHTLTHRPAYRKICLPLLQPLLLLLLSSKLKSSSAPATPSSVCRGLLTSGCCSPPSPHSSLSPELSTVF